MKWTLAALAVALATAAWGQEHQHPTETITGEDATFYEGWMMPDDPGRSCCNRQDCHRTYAYHERGKWFAKSRVTGEWVEVPASKIERVRDVPLGAHLCENTSGVLCFGVGTGG